MSYRSIILADNPYLYYRLGSASTLVDETGTFNGVYGGPPPIVSGALPNDPDTAREILNAGQKYGRYTPDPANGKPYMTALGQATAVCIEAWIRSVLPDASVTERFFLCGTAGVSYWNKSVFAMLDTSKWAGFSKNAIMVARMDAAGYNVALQNTTALANLHDQQWHHVVFVVDRVTPANSRIYFDATSLSVAPISVTNPLPSGEDFTDQSFDVGRMGILWYGGQWDVDELAVYINSNVLTAAKVAAHYNARYAAPGGSREMPRGIGRGIWP